MNKSRVGDILNALIIISSLAGLLMVRQFGFSMLFYYTQDSNILAIIASVMYLTRQRSAYLWRYAAFVCLTVTFLVVVFVLIPMMGHPFYMLFGGGMIFHHTASPILSFITNLRGKTHGFNRADESGERTEYIDVCLINIYICGIILVWKMYINIPGLLSL